MPSASIVLVSPIITTHTCHGSRDYLFQQFCHECETPNIGVGDTIQIYRTSHSSWSDRKHLSTFHCTVTRIYGYSLAHIAFTLDVMSTTLPHTLYVPIAFARLSNCQRAWRSLILLPRRCLGALHSTRTSGHSN
jgi:hypothetical protein